MSPAGIVRGMCPYGSASPTTPHREGTKYPVIVGMNNHNRKVKKEGRQVKIVFFVLLAVAAPALSLYWFVIR